MPISPTSPKTAGLAALAAGGALGFLGWLPFMSRGEWLALPLRIYLGGYGKYSVVNAKAANLYAFGNHYLQPDSDIWFWGISFSTISMAVTAAALLWLPAPQIRCRRNTGLTSWPAGFIPAGWRWSSPRCAPWLPA